MKLQAAEETSLQLAGNFLEFCDHKLIFKLLLQLFRSL
jgi:hypothetical protein